jgi:recombinase-like zinc beta ribbon protein/HNH endonuclease
MLTNLRYSAQSTFRREVLASGDWPGYLTPVQQQRIIDGMLRNRAENRERRRPAANLLAGIAVCGDCGGRLRVTASRVSAKGPRRRRYVCANHTLPTTHSCAAAPLDAEMLETLLLANLHALLTAADPPPSSTIATVEDPERALRDRVRQAAATADDELLDQAIEQLTASRDPTGVTDLARHERAVRELLASPLDAAPLDREAILRVNGLLREVLITLAVRVAPDMIELAGVLRDGTRRGLRVDRAAWIRTAPAGRRRTVSHQTWERAEIIGTLQAWVDEHRRSPTTVDWKLGAADRPTASKVLHSFLGDWNRALDAAGLPPVKECRHLWSDQEILNALRSWTLEHGRAPLGIDWLKAAAGRPVTATVRERFGSWRAALAATERG